YASLRPTPPTRPPARPRTCSWPPPLPRRWRLPRSSQGASDRDACGRPYGKAGSPGNRLAADEQLGEVGGRHGLRHQAAGHEHAFEIVDGIAAIIGLVETHGEAFEKPVPAWSVAHLQAVEEN